MTTDSRRALARTCVGVFLAAAIVAALLAGAGQCIPAAGVSFAAGVSIGAAGWLAWLNRSGRQP